ncbi:HK97 family phage prohead protease [Mycobacteroides saopaulense]|uniref:Primosomal replication protein N n=1 Tax=Mycobacteroides saopaulense TaxID=1578165 RepID=A0ABX3BYD3_9MYCO|nr:HK97 family phage prohead protease [Mycobacteroides saopaulense]OHT86909.1 primosomal replication protein N [Mycobacteroides saopaulense]OHU08764.1 primosomal replication protein N [Mycobacteroides saopaulense]
MTEKKTPPREDLCRSVPFTVLRSDEEHGDGRTFRGYAAVFNSPTRIDSWEGTFDEQIAPGAFRKSLKERTPKFQFDHGHHPLIGSVPIGGISDIHEDDRGLYVESRLGQHILIDLIREALTPPELGGTGAIDGMSFRFSVVRDEWHDRYGKLVKPEEVDQILYRDPDSRGPLLRTLKEVKLAEVGPVVWPAYADTTASVRSIVEIDRTRLNEPEQRRLLAELLLRADAVDHAPERGESEPQDTTEEVAVEHSDDDTDAPQPTEQAGEHEPEPETEQEDPTPPEDRNADDDLFATALAEVRNAMELNPPLKGL